MAIPRLAGGVTETVVGRALLIVLQDVVGFVEFLEFDFGAVIAGIAIGMQLHRELAVFRLQFGNAGALLAPKGLVIATLHDRNTEHGIQGSDALPMAYLGHRLIPVICRQLSD